MDEDAESAGAPPDVLFVTGPAAVGKMTVGRAIAERTGFGLLHNHLTIEPLLALFPFGSPPFKRLLGEFRLRLAEEAAASDLPGLILTFVWAHELPEEREQLDTYARLFRARGGRVLHLELAADQEERLRRNVLPDRLAAKPSKRDVAWSCANLREMDAEHRLRSEPGELDGWADLSLFLDNTRLPAAAVAEAATARFGLAPLAGAP